MFLKGKKMVSGCKNRGNPLNRGIHKQRCYFQYKEANKEYDSKAMFDFERKFSNAKGPNCIIKDTTQKVTLRGEGRNVKEIK